MSSSSTSTTSTLRGSFTAVRAATETVQPKDLSAADNVYEREIDLESLPEGYREAVEADDFIVYGKASVEQYDRGNPDEGQPPQKLEMDALVDALSQYLDAPSNGAISFGHDDVIVGRVIQEYTFDEAREFEVGNETFQVDAGETVSTHVENDEFWIVANIGNATYIERKVRILSLAGVLNGFSVTVVPRDWAETDAGQRVTALDWHSVTVGTDEQILNPDAEYGVAAFKARPLGDLALRSPDDADASPAASVEGQTGTQSHGGILQMGITNALAKKLGLTDDFAAALNDAQQKAADDDLSQREAVQAAFDANDYGDVEQDAVLNAMNESATKADDDASDGADETSESADSDDGDDDDESDQKADDGLSDEELVDLAQEVADEAPLSITEALKMLEQAMAGGGSPEEAAKAIDAHADTPDGGSGHEEDLRNIAEAVADILDVPMADVMDALGSLTQSAESGDEADDDVDRGAVDDAEQKSDGSDAIPDDVVTEDELETKLDERVAEMEENLLSDLSEHMEETVEDGLDDLSQHLDAGGTPDPASGSTQDSIDLDSELTRLAEERPARSD